ncbi:hypothetical protein DFH09DRAFT_1324948 [Mycena vulgaris]|nr:hypothetical protein DFH09DRAFT_1324948 [Mycena vulgaris]
MFLVCPAQARDSGSDSASFASLVFPTTDSTQLQTSAKTDLAKSVIEWLFVVIAIILLICLFLRKTLGARTPLREIHAQVFTEPRASDDASYVYTYAYPGIPALHLTRPPPARIRARAHSPVHATLTLTRALDLGAGGRRANWNAELVLSDQDVLPAYDGLDRPPKYVHAEAATEEPPAASASASAEPRAVVEAPGAARVELPDGPSPQTGER